MVLWLIRLLLDHFDPQESEVGKLWGDIIDFFPLKVNILRIQSVPFS